MSLISKVKCISNIKYTKPIVTKYLISSTIQKRFYSNEEAEESPKEVKVEKLKTRSLLSIEGADALDFLQALTTNDIKQLEEGKRCVFTAFLNAKGRVIHDALVYKSDEKNEYLVECDICSLQALQVHMKMYRGRREVEVKSAEDEVCVWVIYCPNEEEVGELELGEGTIVCPDPRITHLGLRVLAPAGMDIAKEVSRQGLAIHRSPISLYRSLRYKLGVGEGSLEIPYGRCTPTEVNCDYLNGISSKKGAFIGMEAAINIKNTMTNENRLMPIFLDLIKSDTFPLNTPIEDVKRKRKTPVGYLRGSQGGVGLGLMKVAEALQEGSVRIGKVIAHCIRPPWWPQGSTVTDK